MTTSVRSDALPIPGPPLRALEDLRTRAAALEKGRIDALAWSRVGYDLAAIGWLAARARAAEGSRLMVRGAALAGLARAVAPADATVLLRFAATLILARHTALAVRLLAPLLEHGVPEARWLLAAAHADPTALGGQQGHPFFYVVAATRLDDPTGVESELETLMRAGLDPEWGLTGTLVKLDPSKSGRYAEEWISGAQGLTGAPGSTGAPPALEPKDAAHRAGAEVHRRLAQLRMPPAPVVFAPIQPGIPLSDERSLGQDLALLPAVQFAQVAATRLSAALAAKAVLAQARRAAPEATSFFPAWRDTQLGLAAVSTLAAGARLLAWEKAWQHVDPTNPWAALSVSTLLRPSEPPGLESADAQDIADLDGALPDVLHPAIELVVGKRSRRTRDLAALRRLEAVDPWDATLVGYDMALEAPGEATAALETSLARAVDRVPQAIGLLGKAASLWVDRGSPARAAKLLEEAARRAPTHPAPWGSRVRLAISGHRLVQAQRVLDAMAASLGRSGDVVSLTCQIAEAWLDMGKIAPAIALIQRAATIDPGGVDVMMGDVRVLIRQGRVREGIDAFQAAFKRHPESPELLVSLVQSLLEGGRGGDAAKLVDDLIQKGMRHPVLLRSMGRCFVALGDARRGRALIEQARKGDPDALEGRDKVFLADTSLSGDPATSHRGDELRAWLAKADPEAPGEIVEAMAANPSAQAVNVLLEGITGSKVGLECALAMSRIAWMDLDLPADPRPADLARAHDRLADWWRLKEPLYPQSLEEE